MKNNHLGANMKSGTWVVLSYSDAPYEVVLFLKYDRTYSPKYQGDRTLVVFHPDTGSVDSRQVHTQVVAVLNKLQLPEHYEAEIDKLEIAIPPSDYPSYLVNKAWNRLEQHFNFKRTLERDKILLGIAEAYYKVDRLPQSRFLSDLKRVLSTRSNDMDLEREQDVTDFLFN